MSLVSIYISMYQPLKLHIPKKISLLISSRKFQKLHLIIDFLTIETMVAQLVKKLPAMQETLVWFLEKE